MDTGQLVLTSSSGWGRTEAGGPIQALPDGVIHLGHKGGEAQLLRIEDAEAVIDNGVLSVAGRLSSEQLATDLPLMEGRFSIDMATLAVTEFTDEGVEASRSLIGNLIDMTFSDIIIGAQGIILRTDLGFDGVLDALSTNGGLLALNIDGDGPSFGLSAQGTGRGGSAMTPWRCPCPKARPTRWNSRTSASTMTCLPTAPGSAARLR